jgi:hypothetical protein
MNISTVTHLGSAAVVTGIATLAFASPAGAMQNPGPEDRGSSPSTTSVTVKDDTNWTGMAAGTAGGVAVLGAGIATAITLRRHHVHPHPAA